MTTVKFEVEIFDNNDSYHIEVEAWGSLRMENDGIGGYEYMGFRGYDRGQDYAECDNIEWDKTIYSDEENTAIQAYIDEKHDDIVEKMAKNAEGWV